MDEDLGFFEEYKGGISPKNKDLQHEQDERANFADPSQDFKVDSVVPHNELTWENNDIPNILTRGELDGLTKLGNSNFEIPSAKKRHFDLNKQFMSDNLDEIIPSTTHSETSGLASSTSFLFF